jgi:putative NIF3 family GTP cyclohydrolase 1 type 2
VAPVKGVEGFNRASPVSGPTYVDVTDGGRRLRRRFADLGFGGPLAAPAPASDFANRVQEVVGRMPLLFSYGPEEIRRAAICSGGAARYLAYAIADGYDCFVTGEADEPTKHLAKEAGIHFVAAGHYATETSGVQALAARVAERFGVEWEFVDLPNPV